MKVPLLLLVFTAGVFSTHYRGAYIQWDAVNSNTFKFDFRSAWRLSAGPCALACAVDPQAWIGKQTTDFGPEWKCFSGCAGNLHDHRYLVNGVNKADDFEQGSDSFTKSFTSDGVKTIGFESCCWIALGKGGNAIRMTATLPVGARSDTGTGDNSPRSAAPPILEVPLNSKISQKLTVSDADGDKVRCRWGTAAEVGGVSQALPGATLDPDTCTLNFETSAANGYKKGTWYAVAIQIEDFPRSTVRIGGKTYTANDAMSSVPLQFLVRVEEYPPGEKPVILPGTDKHIINPGSTFTDKVCGKAFGGTSIKEWELVGPLGMTKDKMVEDKTKGTAVKCASITYKPTAGQKGIQTYCFHVKDSVNRRSEEVCRQVDVQEKVDPCAAAPCKNGGKCVAVGDKYTCTCAVNFTGTNCETAIDWCAKAPCRNGATCVSGTGGYTCRCLAGFEGRDCEKVIPGPCASNPCLNGGQCLEVSRTEYKCSCPRAYLGRNCENKRVSPCASGPCKNGGTCKDYGNVDFQCLCPPDASGKFCEYLFTTTTSRATHPLCTLANLRANNLLHAHPVHKHMYLRCDFTGQIHEMVCPQKGQVFFVRTKTCALPECKSIFEPLLPITFPGQVKLPSSERNPCAVDGYRAGLLYFTYKPDATKYIQCDLFGQAFVKPCGPGEIWDQKEATCNFNGIPTNPNKGPTADPSRFRAPCTADNVAKGLLQHVHTDADKYIQCTRGGEQFVIQCPPKTVYKPALKQCDY